MGKFRQILTELPARDTPIFSFPDDNLSKHQWIFTKLGVCIDIKEIWFGIANGQISSMFTELSARDMIMAGYYSLTFLLKDNKQFYHLKEYKKELDLRNTLVFNYY